MAILIVVHREVWGSNWECNMKELSVRDYATTLPIQHNLSLGTQQLRGHAHAQKLIVRGQWLNCVNGKTWFWGYIFLSWRKGTCHKKGHLCFSRLLFSRSSSYNPWLHVTLCLCHQSCCLSLLTHLFLSCPICINEPVAKAHTARVPVWRSLYNLFHAPGRIGRPRQTIRGPSAITALPHARRKYTGKMGRSRDFFSRCHGSAPMECYYTGTQQTASLSLRVDYFSYYKKCMFLLQNCKYKFFFSSLAKRPSNIRPPIAVASLNVWSACIWHRAKWYFPRAWSLWRL